MGDMHIPHEQVSGTNCCNALVRHSAAVNGYILPYLVIVTDNKFRVLALVFQVLGRGANRGKGTDNIS
jgi:hypothetical protein